MVMSSVFRVFFIAAVLFVLSGHSFAQADEICGESAGSTWMTTPFVYGRVLLNGFEGRKLPKVTVVLYDRSRSESRQTIDKSGYYCFRNTNGAGGFVAIEVEGLEVVRRSLPSGSGPAQFREDFEINPTHPEKTKPPSAISAKYAYPRNGKNAELFEKASAAEKEKQMGKAAQFLKEMVAADPADFVAWAKLGSAYYEQNQMSEAEAALKKAIEAKADYGPAHMNLGRVYMMQKNVDQAIEKFDMATAIDPSSARAFQLLGEAYLLARKGTLGVAALNEAIRLDPIGMAECHLLMARLYDLAGVKPLASREYRLFLEKVPQHADKKKFEKYIKDNPEQAESK